MSMSLCNCMVHQLRSDHRLNSGSPYTDSSACYFSNEQCDPVVDGAPTIKLESAKTKHERN